MKEFGGDTGVTTKGIRPYSVTVSQEALWGCGELSAVGKLL